MTVQEQELLIGLASADITPPIGCTLVGYTPRQSTELGLRLRAEALVCLGHGGAWALVTSDTIGYPLAYSKRVRQAIASATGLAAGAVILTGTHTHSGPSTVSFGDEGQAPLDRQYLDQLNDELVALVARAHASAAAGSFEVAYTHAPLLGHNRRIRMPDGIWGNEWQDPQGRHQGYYDPTVMLVAVRRPDGAREGLLINFGCHPVVLGPASLAISGDYAGYLKLQLESAGGSGIPLTMFALAACGNINPRICIQTGSEHPQQMADALAKIIVEALPRLKPVASGAVAAACVPWSITRTRDAIKRRNRPGSQTGEAIATEVVAARAGDLGLVAIPGELFSEFNPRLRQRSPATHTLVVTLANDYIGYIPTDRAQEEGAYETRMAPADQMEEPLLEHAHQALRAVDGGRS
jgi:neutral ceramidase